QVFYHGIANGIDHADLIEVFAPKPYLMVTTTRDFFSIQGARETFAEVNKAYKAFGQEENFTMVEDDYTHGYTKINREAVYAFFQESLDMPGSPNEEKVDILDMEELNITPTGQILSYLQGETISSINKKETQKNIEKIKESRKNVAGHLERVKQNAKQLSGYAEPYGEEKVIFRGRYQRNGYNVEMYAIQGEDDYVIPLLLMIPNGGGEFPAIIYIHPEGKAADEAVGGRIEELVKRGCIVAAPDVIGIGETRDPSTYPGRPSYGAVIVGRNIVGIQAGDIVRVVNMLKKRPDVKQDKISAVAFDELCPALLHAAVFEPSIKATALINSPVSYMEIVNNKVYNYSMSFIWGVAGALNEYDLPDLAACIAPRKLLMIDVKDAMKHPASNQLVKDELEFPLSVYRSGEKPENFRIESNIGDGDIDSFFDWWVN
ncbi:xylan esterase, partial [candidate division KSB1 bacterium]|nr:xylan esterase [candidate division KSB1 bacterium]